MFRRATASIFSSLRRLLLSLIQILLFLMFIFRGGAALAETVTWNVDADGDWQTGSNWSTGLPPGIGDDVVIDRAAGEFIITVSTGDQFAGTITCAENLEITGGTLTVASTVQVAGTFSLEGGKIIDAVIQSSLNCSGSGLNLQGVTLAGDLLVGVGENTLVTVTDGLLLNGTAYLGQGANYGLLNFSGTQTLDGTGTVEFSDNGSNSLRSMSGTLTIGPDILVHGARGRIQGFPDFVNQGTVSSDAPAGLISVDGTNWRNEGVFEAKNGGGLSLGGTVTTADLGDVRGSDGQVELDCVLENTGDTLALDAVTGSWILDHGTILGGAVAPGADGAAIIYQGTYGKLDGVVMDADMVVSEVNNTYVTILNGLTLNGTAHVGYAGNYGRFNFSGTQTLDGTGEILFSDNGSNTLYGYSGTFTIGPDILVHGIRGRLQGPNGFVNQGTISSDAAGGLIVLDAAGWRNEGVVEAVAGGGLSLDGTVTTADLGEVRGSGGQVELDGILDNTGDVLALDGVTGSWILDNGTILGGTVAPGADGAAIIYQGTSGKLDGVTMDADMVVSEVDNTYVTILNGLTLNGIAHVGYAGNYGRLNFTGTQTVDGTGEILFSDNGSNTVYGASGTLTIGPDILVHGVRGKLFGGSVFVNQGTIDADQAGGIITLDGSGWTNQGTLESTAGILAILTPLANTGLAHVAPGGLIDTDDVFTQTLGATRVDSAGVFHSDLTIDIQGGELTGYGTVEGTLANTGVIGPGASAGTLAHTGDFSQAAAGTLGIELGGVEYGLFDRLTVTGTAALDGVLDVDWIYNFSPAAGDSFVVMDFGSRSGTFAVEDFPALPPGLDLVAEYDTTSLVLRVVGSELYAVISQISDVPADEGGFVDVTFSASTLDDPVEPDPIVTYEIQRFGAAWEQVGLVPATGAPLYGAVVPTPDILTIGEPEPWGYFRILARTATPGVFYSSPSDSGFSLDNLPPPPPVLELTEDLDERVLSWTNPGVADLDVTCLYRTDELGSLPDTLLFCTTDTTWTETHQFYYNYYAQAIDIHGNAGDFSEVVEYVYPTGVGERVPSSPVLATNVPNPFNPGTVIGFSLPRTMEAELTVYGLDGRRIKTLVSGIIPSGTHACYWNGRDSGNRKVAAGVYLYRLKAGDVSLTGRMLLLK